MSIPVTVLFGLLIAITLFVGYWVIQYVINDSGIVDVFWGASVAVIGVFFCVATSGDLTRRWIGAVLVSVWAARLSLYLYWRWKSHEEDGRYAALKKKWGAHAQIRMFRFYQMQGLGALLFALPLLVAGTCTRPINWLDGVAVVVCALSILGEAISDYQLQRFRESPDNRGEVCQVGFWKYSRHPNYFFEWLHWWTYVLLSISSPWGWTTIVAPLAMWLFLNRVTGIPLAELQAVKSRGEKYRQYQRTTSAFFPWFPAAGASKGSSREN